MVGSGEQVRGTEDEAQTRDHGCEQGKEEKDIRSHHNLEASKSNANLAAHTDRGLSTKLEPHQDSYELGARLEQLDGDADGGEKVDPASDHSGDAAREVEPQSKPNTEALAQPNETVTDVKAGDGVGSGTGYESWRGLEALNETRDGVMEDSEEQSQKLMAPVTVPTNPSHNSDCSEPIFTFTAPLPMDFTVAEGRDEEVIPHVDALNANESKAAGDCPARRSEKEEPIIIDAGVDEKTIALSDPDKSAILDAVVDWKVLGTSEEEKAANNPADTGLALDRIAAHDMMEVTPAVHESGIAKSMSIESEDNGSYSSSQSAYILSTGKPQRSTGDSVPQVETDRTPQHEEREGASRPSNTLLHYPQSPQSPESPQCPLSPQSVLSPQSPSFQEGAKHAEGKHHTDEAERDISAAQPPQSPQATPLERSPGDGGHASPLQEKQKPGEDPFSAVNGANPEAPQNSDEPMSPTSPQFRCRDDDNLETGDVEPSGQAGKGPHAQLQSLDGKDMSVQPRSERQGHDRNERPIPNAQSSTLSPKSVQKKEDWKRSTALYSPGGPEFKMPGTSDELSEEVRYSLSMLPLMNVAVHIPAFAEFEPPTQNDMAVVRALDDVILQETRKRRSDRHVMAKSRRSILFITCSTARALACWELLGKRSELRVTTHGINSRSSRGGLRRRREDFKDSKALDSLFAFQDVIITLASTALMDAERDFLYLKRIVLIVFDIDFQISKENEPSFSERGHHCSVLMRDYYRALPSHQRPRVLAISRIALRPVEYPPIEHNLFCKFLSIDVKEGAAWKSCYGSGSRPDDSMMDVETLYYRVATSADINPQDARDRRQSTPKKRSRRNMSELDLLSEEVGPLGVALYQRRFKYRYDSKKSLTQKTSVNINSSFRITCEEALTGLSQKMLHLLNELQVAYAASTIDSPLMAVIHAGTPSTAGAVAAIISAVPIFEGLAVRLAIGSKQGSSFESYGPDDNGTTRGLQGDETDEEAVSAFGSGEANILIVATPYSTCPTNDLVAPCPLIFRFDDSVPDPGVDGGGGRCRVVDFQESRSWRSSRCINGAQRRRSAERKYSGSKRGEGGESSDSPVGRRGPFGAEVKIPSAPKENSLDNSSDDEHVEKVQKPGETAMAPAPQSENIQDEENTTVYHRMPPQVLLGPSSRENRTCFMYRILVCPLDDRNRSQTKLCRRVGVEDFLFVFSQMLPIEDKTCPLPEISARAGSFSGIAGNLELSYQGQVELSREEIELGRLYTAAMFSVASESMDVNNVFWDSIDSGQRGGLADQKFLRQYLILPALKSVQERENKRIEESPKTRREELFDKYFSTRSETVKFPWPFAKCSVDWEAARLLTDRVQEREDEVDKVTAGKVSPGAWSDLEGCLIISKLKGKKSMLCGHLQYDISPLTPLTRSRKFPLNNNGTLKDHHDLIHVFDVKASARTVALQAKETAVNKDEGHLDQEEGHNGSVPCDGTTRPVRWDAAEKKLVFDCRMERDKEAVERMALFDCERNQKKKRSVWTGRVSYNYEKYYKAYSSTPVSHFDQPLLLAGIPSTSSYEQFLRVVRGAHISTICKELITTNRSESQFRMVIPEICERLPVPIGAIFLPAVLARVERHLSLCQLRKYFDSRIGVRGSLEILRQSVTASHIDPFCNYERLELLGDAVLKLTCTIRLFTTRPHDTEGQMHNARSFRVSNERLHRLGIRAGIHNYLIFDNETEKDYRPPGTDFQGKPVKVTVKALADVVESVCGAYFLHGVNSPRILGKKRRKNRVRSEKERGFESSDSNVETESAECSEDEMDVTPEGTNTRKDMDERRSSVERVDDNSSDLGEQILPLSASAVERGYITGYKFLEVCGVFEDKEPTHKEVLLSAIHAMHPPKERAPTEINGRAFPPDRRLSQPSKPWEEQFGPLEKKLGYVFKRRPLLMCALTHASYIKSSGRETAQHQTFQRLEFLGDAIADFCVVRFLYERYPELGPGELTNLKSNVVSNEAFARTAVQLGLQEHLFHGSTSFKAEIEKFTRALADENADGKGIHGGLKRCLGEIAAPKVLGDIFEAVIGAIYVDSGLKTVWTVCMRLLADSLRINADPGREDMHPVTELQDLVMRVWGLSHTAPDYQVRSVSGGQGKVATVTIGGRKIATGRGSTLKRAKLKAAVSALKLLQDEDGDSVGAKLLRELKEEHVARVVAGRF